MQCSKILIRQISSGANTSLCLHVSTKQQSMPEVAIKFLFHNKIYLILLKNAIGKVKSLVQFHPGD
jgi:hypothetical protein